MLTETPAPTGATPATADTDGRGPRKTPHLRRHLRLLCRKLHLGSALSLGVLYTVVCVTGALCLFRPELDRWLSAGFYPDRPPTPPPGLYDVVAADIHARYPGVRIQYLATPAYTGSWVEAWLESGDREREAHVQWRAYYDPRDGRYVAQTRDHTLPALLAAVGHFHGNLFLGEVGSYIVGISGFAGLTFSLTGIVLWWPGIRNWLLGFTIRWGRSPHLRHFDLHKVAGILATPALLLASLTGIWFVFPQIKEALLGRPAEHAPPPTSASPAPTNALTDYTAVYTRATQAAAPGAQVSWLPGLASASEGVLTVYLTYDGNPDPYAGGILTELRAADGHLVHLHDSRVDPLPEWLSTNTFGLHIGTWGGLPGRLMYLLAGLAPLLLAYTGWRLWHRRSARTANSGA